MRTIGLRADPHGLEFAVFCSESEQFLNVEAIKIPVAFSKPEGLKFLRNNLLDLLGEYEVRRAGVRLPESLAKQVNIDRVYIEAVIQEAFASSDLEAYFAGPIATIERLLKLDRGGFKIMIEGTNTLEIGNWELMKDH